jgi:putative sterol carrier protein
MATAYNPDKGGDFTGIFQFDFTDREPNSYYLEIKDQHCQFKEGHAENPDLLIHTPWKVWKAIGKGELSGQEAFMDGKYTVEGDMGLLVRLGQMFGD